MSIDSIFNSAKLELMELNKCVIGGTFFHKGFAKVGNSSHVVLHLLKEDTMAYYHWYDVRYPNDIKGDGKLPLTYKVLVAQPKEVKKGMPLICASCNTRQKHLWLDLKDGKSKCESCLANTISNTSRVRTGNSLIKLKSKNGNTLVSCNSLNVNFENYMKLNSHEKYMSLLCIMDAAVIKKIIEYEKTDAGSKTRANRAIKRLKRITK